MISPHTNKGDPVSEEVAFMLKTPMKRSQPYRRSDLVPGQSNQESPGVGRMGLKLV